MILVDLSLNCVEHFGKHAAASVSTSLATILLELSISRLVNALERRRTSPEIFSSIFSSIAWRREAKEKDPAGAGKDAFDPVSEALAAVPLLWRCLIVRDGLSFPKLPTNLIAVVSLIERRNSIAELTLPSHASRTLLMTSGSTLVN